MQDVITAFYMTMELWIFLAILMLALVVEQGVVAHNRKKLQSNPALR